MVVPSLMACCRKKFALVHVACYCENNLERFSSSGMGTPTRPGELLQRVLTGLTTDLRQCKKSPDLSFPWMRFVPWPFMMPQPPPPCARLSIEQERLTDAFG
ncbi:hypothetical protein [Herbaspirillum sp. C9C3]|uniref:hypothetical protein n=1 Tax=Herbaspirillum sp. C9C3 TaxID=2735271 RepID=UPI0015859CDE|nr:hypothetical protein [Herbaspirillum sp. C9C3]NUT62923.1 hypothetical protein [Herbaspirillum sp. C9C3]